MNRPTIKTTLWTAQQGRCLWCGRATWLPGTVRGEDQRGMATFEHIVPRSRGGTNTPDNLAVACSACNQSRGLHPTAFSLHPHIAPLLSPAQKASWARAQRIAARAKRRRLGKRAKANA